MFVSAHDTRGGTTNFIKVLRSRFKGDGRSCQSVALYPGFIQDPSGVETVLTGNKKPGLLQLAGAVGKLIGLARQMRPGFILGVMPFANVAAAIAGRLSGATVVCTHHSPYETNGRLVRTLDTLVGTLGLYRDIVCVSKAVAESFGGHPAAYRRRLRVIANGVPAISARSDRQSTLARLALPSDLPIVFMAGRLAPQKNVLMAVRAMAQVEGARLVMSGEGPQREELLALARELGIADRVHLLGLIDRQDMVDLMFHCDAFMQISLFEGQSMSLLEALYARALPVVSNIPVQTEVIDLGDGRLAGVVCNENDPADVARAVRALLFDTATRAEVRANVLSLAPGLRTEAQMLDDYARLLEDRAA